MFLFSDLIGYKIRATDDEFGTVHDLLVDDRTWDVRYVTVDTGGWLLGRRVLIAPLAVGIPDAQRQELPVNLTKEEVKDSPEIAIDVPISREQEALYRDHFRWPYYWGDANAFDRLAMISPAPEATMLGSAVPGPADMPPAPEAPTDANLRSARILKGYKLIDRDGSEDKHAGEVVDLMIRAEDWTVPYLVVELVHEEDRRIVVPTRSTGQVGWPERVMRTDLPAELLARAPLFEDITSIDDRFAKGVADHYSRNI